MTTESIRTTIAAFTAHARKFADITVWENSRLPTDTEIGAPRVAVLALCDRLDSLGGDPESTFSYFKSLSCSLAHFPATPPGLVSAVVDAFLAADRLDANA